ncbi:hypothetical protein BgiBS90_021814, partial [Biomphalaria glabrata]
DCPQRLPDQTLNLKNLTLREAETCVETSKSLSSASIKTRLATYTLSEWELLVASVSSRSQTVETQKPF